MILFLISMHTFLKIISLYRINLPNNGGKKTENKEDKTRRVTERVMKDFNIIITY